MEAIDRKLAEKEIEEWMDFKNLSKRKREDNKETIETLINAVEDGVISIDPSTKVMTHKLHLPIENSDGEVTVRELKYQPRVKVFEIHKGLKGVKGDDVHGMVLAYASVITGLSKEIIKNLDTSDYSLVQSVSVFFM